MKALVEKASVLVEALPYIQKYAGKIAVIKLGAYPLLPKAMKKATMRDIVLLKYTGMHPVIVHGGGPGITKEMERRGKEPKFINGLRVTDEETVQVVKKVFSGINKEIVDYINLAGGKARPVRGDKGLFKIKPKGGKLGYVGEVTKVSPKEVLSAVKKGGIPVVAPMGMGPKGKTYNINADTAATKLAVALKAEKLTFMTGVEGFLEKGRLIPTLTVKQAKAKIRKGIATAGMIPKLEAGIYAVSNGVKKAHLINGDKKHALLIEIYTDKGIGTEVVK